MSPSTQSQAEDNLIKAIVSVTNTVERVSHDLEKQAEVVHELTVSEPIVVFVVLNTTRPINKTSPSICMAWRW